MSHAPFRLVRSLGFIVAALATVAVSAADLPRRHRAASPRRALPEQLPRVRAERHRGAAEVAHGSVPRRPAEAASARDAARRRGPRLPARQRRRRRGDGAVADLDRPRQHADPGGRRQHPHRPDVLRARVAVRLRRAEAPPAAGAGARRAAAHRRRRHLAQPLRPSRRGEREGARRAGRRAAALRRAARPQGVVRRRRHQQRRRARLVADRTASARSRSC